MEINEFLCFLNKAKEAQKRDEAFQQWTSLLPYMSLGYFEYERFENYYNRITGKNIDTRPAEVIIAEIEELHSKFKKGEN